MQLFAQSNYITCTNGSELYRMAYNAWGTQTIGGKTLLCVHGLSRNCRDWDFVARHFVKLGYYVVAPDIVGRGNSDYLTNWVGYNIPNYVKDILLLIKVLGLENIDFIGTSMGGLIAMSIAILPQSPINKLVLNDIGAEIEIPGLERINAYNAAPSNFNTLAEAREHILATSLDFAIPPELEEFYTLTSFQKNYKGKYELKRDGCISYASKMYMLHNRNIELWEFWQKVDIATLVIHGVKSDILTHATIERMKAIKPKTQSVSVYNAGHAPYLYSSEHMQFLQDFLHTP